MARPLRRPSDFQKFIGERCELSAIATEGQRRYKGIIAAADETSVTLETEDGEQTSISFDDVKKCTLKPTFDFKKEKGGK